MSTMTVALYARVSSEQQAGPYGGSGMNPVRQSLA